MSSSEFSVDFSRFYHPKVEVLPDPDKHGPHNRKELPRFLFRYQADEFEEARVQGEKLTKFLDVVAKIMLLTIRIIFVLMPLGIGYLPAWVPWGIGLPTAILLMLAHGSVAHRVKIWRRENEFYDFFKEFLKHHTGTQHLHPIGEWDLPQQDERLKSDLMVQMEDVKKYHPKSAERIEMLFGGRSKPKAAHPDFKRFPCDLESPGDLEVTPNGQLCAALEFAGRPLVKEQWDHVKELGKEAKKALLPKKNEVLDPERQKVKSAFYHAKHSEALKAAYGHINKIPFDDYDFPPLSLKGVVDSVMVLYSTLCQEISKGQEQFEKGKTLYTAYAFLEEGGGYPNWPKHLEVSREIKNKVAPLIELLEKKTPPATAAEFLRAFSYIQKNQLHMALLVMIEQTRKLQKEITAWQSKHPAKRLKELEETIKEWDEKDVLSEASLKRIAKWIAKHPQACKKACIEIPEEKKFLNEEMTSWFQSHKKMRLKTPEEILEESSKIRDALDEADDALTTLQVNIGLINSKESYEEYCDALDGYKKEIIVPLNEKISLAGKESKINFLLRVMFSKEPAEPFAKEELPEEQPLRMRKIEEFRLNRMLRAQDAHMLWTNRVRKFGVTIPYVLLLVVEAIFAFYVTSHWLYWSCGFVTAALGGVSYLVDYRLKIMEKKKQAIKLQLLLMNHPDIKEIPGTRPRLKELKTVQQNYGLEGVRPTWAKMLMEGDKALAEPKDLESAKEMLSDLAKEGSEKATKYLQDRLILMMSEYQQMNKKSAQARQVKKTIFSTHITLLETDQLKSLSNSLKAKYKGLGKKTKTPKAVALKEKIRLTKQELDRRKEKVYEAKTITPYEELTIRRNEVDKVWDRVGEEILGANIKLKELEQKRALCDSLPKKIERLQAELEIREGLLGLIKAAAAGEDARDSKEDLGKLLDEYTKIFQEMQKNEEEQEDTTERQMRLLEQLRKIPKEQFEYFVMKYHRESHVLEHNILRSNRQYQRIVTHKKVFGPPEVLDQRIQDWKDRLADLEEDRALLKENYDALTQQIKELPAAKSCPK